MNPQILRIQSAVTLNGMDSLSVTKPDPFPSVSPAAIPLLLALQVPPPKWKVSSAVGWQMDIPLRIPGRGRGGPGAEM